MKIARIAIESTCFGRPVVLRLTYRFEPDALEEEAAIERVELSYWDPVDHVARWTDVTALFGYVATPGLLQRWSRQLRERLVAESVEVEP